MKKIEKRPIAHICLAPSWGGLDMWSVKMTALFSEHDYPVYCICREGTPIHKNLLERGLNAIPVSGRNYFSPSISRGIKQAIKKHDIQTIYCHWLKDLWLLWPALRKHSAVRLVGFARMFYRDVNKKDYLHRKIYSRLNRLICLSSIQQSHIKHCLPLEEDKYIVIPNGVDVNKFKPRERNEQLRKEWSVAPNELLIGMIGRFHQLKGQEEFIRAARMILDKFPNCKFIAIGADTVDEDSNRAEIKDLIKELNLQDQVIIADHRTDIPEILNALDIFTMPSYEENFGNVLLEAIASGLPNVATNSGGTPEIVEDGVSGLLVDPANSEALAGALLRLVESEELRTQMSKEARKRAETEFDLERVFERIASLASPQTPQRPEPFRETAVTATTE